MELRADEATIIPTKRVVEAVFGHPIDARSLIYAAIKGDSVTTLIVCTDWARGPLQAKPLGPYELCRTCCWFLG